MNTRCGKRPGGAMTTLLLVCLLGAACAQAQGQERPGDKPRLQEISDAELAAMRGRYTLDGNAVAWFGVSMISHWHSADGQQLAAGLQLGIDLRQGTPKFTYQPTINIVQAAMAEAQGGAVVRQIDSSGLGHVSGFVQAVQLAGDGNRVSNQAQLVIGDGQVPEGSSGQPGSAQGSAGPATVQAYVEGQRAGVILQLAGQGQVQQWLGNGQVGQSVALASDGSWVSNQLRLEVVRGPAVTGGGLAQNVAQALGSSRGLGTIGGP